MTRDEILERQQREHDEKYARLVEVLGFDALVRLLPELHHGRTWAGLVAGDRHLNQIPLAAWDRAAGCGLPPRTLPGPRWPQPELRATARLEPWCRAPQLSLSDRVCVLKHVARRLAAP